MKVLFIVLLFALFGCNYSLYRQPKAPWYKTSVTSMSVQGDKDAVYNELLTWTNTLYETRRKRVKYCELADQDVYYLAYCLELNDYHTKAETYVTVLQTKYSNMCTGVEYKNE